ncbi:MAG: amidase [Burkholderiaceae bacterium]|nr:amidase [Burkholderiaceae bacterium]MDO9090488.1 amidase [Burkholderiaceae bacterium]
MTALWRQSAVAMSLALRQRRIPVEQLVQAHLDRIASREPLVKAWAWCDPDAVMAQVRELASKPLNLPLYGLPVGVKDIIDTADMPTAYGSPIYSGHRPGADATVVTRLRRAGAILMGKTATTEFAYTHPTATVNPIQPAHTPGGSSSGSAAAVADGMVPLALSSQSGGSTLRPASYCGIVGFKPSFGAAAMTGIKALAPTLDTLGLHARCVDDIELLWSVLNDQATDSARPLARKPRLALFPGPYAAQADADAGGALERACGALCGAGWHIAAPALDLALFAQSGPASQLIMAREAASALAPEFSSHRAQISPAMTRLIERGLAATETQYREARALIDRCREALDRTMTDFDGLLTYSAAGAAPKLSEGTGDSVFNRSWTAMGAPCVSLPAGLNRAGLPLGLQFVDAPGQDARLLGLARQAEILFEPLNRRAD